MDFLKNFLLIPILIFTYRSILSFKGVQTIPRILKKKSNNIIFIDKNPKLFLLLLLINIFSAGFHIWLYIKLIL